MKARIIEGLDPTAPLLPNAVRIVRARLDELSSLAAGALDPSATEAQHDLRIAAKRLRYLLDIVGTCFGAEGAAARSAAKNLQSVLGDIHDCDVMLPRVEGIESLTKLLRARRELLFRRFHDLWQAEASRGTWIALERSM